ncbi:MAG: C4-dicarboxylate ABC transporter substrate-binding protein [Desulfocapsa sp.]|nr:MAG: C4-dicarboxylate ABC transporter substrate-binding protein [Desulfocapsa sp.]
MEIIMRKLSLSLAIIIFGISVVVLCAQAKPTFITIGTGGITGVYYPTGGAIAKMVNRGKKKHHIRAIVESTGGSVFNIDAIVAGKIEFGLVQSDRQAQAINGLAEWKQRGPQTKLRAVFSLYPEAVTLIAAVDSGIKSIRDLKGKHVSIGNIGSGQRQNAIDALTAAGLDYKKDLQTESFKAIDASNMLQDKQIDAFFYTVGHPSGSIKEATSGARKVLIANITDADTLLDKFHYYTKATIPVKLYPGAANDKDISTIGVKATLVTAAEVPADVVYLLTKAVFDNLDDFKL